jgi:uncharacterized SAM-binding protein YcdF (DUF218 family)
MPVRRRRWGLLRFLLLAPLLAALLLGAGFLWFLDAASAPPADPARPTDGIAVLTGGGERVQTGLRLLAEGKARLLLVSGAHPDVTLGDLARAAGLGPGDLAGRVSLGRAARTTRGNAAEIAAWARAEQLSSIRVVTAGYHMPRALLELRRALPEAELLAFPVVPAPLRDAAAAGRARTWSLLAGEYLKLLGALIGLASPADRPGWAPAPPLGTGGAVARIPPGPPCGPSGVALLAAARAPSSGPDPIP